MDNFETPKPSNNTNNVEVEIGDQEKSTKINGYDTMIDVTIVKEKIQAWHML